MISRLLIGIKDTDSRLQKKSPEDGFILRSLTPDCKPRAQLTQHNKRQPDHIRCLDDVDSGLVASAQVGVPIGVQR
jgi:hypothetical protein